MSIFFWLAGAFAFLAYTGFVIIKLRDNYKEINYLRNDFENHYISNAEFFDSKIEELKASLETLVQVVQVTEKQRTVRYRLKNELESSCDTILGFREINERFKHICIAGRKATLEFGEMIMNTGLVITKENLEAEAGYHFDSLKNRCDSWFKEIRQTILFNETPQSFKILSKYLKENSRIKEYISILMIRLIDTKTGKYNGKTNEIIISALVEFMENVLKEGIRAFEEFQTLPIFMEIDGEMKRI